MSPRVFDSFMAALIRIGLLVALVIMLIAEKSQAQISVQPHIVQTGCSAVSVASSPGMPRK
jgi:hypothetical protein